MGEWCFLLEHHKSDKIEVVEEVLLQNHQLFRALLLKRTWTLADLAMPKTFPDP